ncbi:MAG TPA: hypothetical protein VD770_02105 [Coxiellaceae bacterium]|nr:hypothetical protein [Coxiellaceae bacterium]
MLKLKRIWGFIFLVFSSSVALAVQSSVSSTTSQPANELQTNDWRFMVAPYVWA